MFLKSEGSLKIVSLLALWSAIALGSCQSGDRAALNDANSQNNGKIVVDGSSTVFPISEAMAEEFMKQNPGVRVAIGISGSGGGFKKFCRGETNISNASRPIDPSEIELCQENQIEYIELPIAFDGITVVVNPKNDFVSCLSVADLKTLWEADAQAKIEYWNQIRGEFPPVKLALYGPGTDSGTYDYFIRAVVGQNQGSRGDFAASEDDNVIVQGVATDPGGIGFFGYAYYEENREKLKAVAIDNGNGCVTPSEETIADGSYTPLSRPEFIYINRSLANRPDIQEFVNFILADENQYLISEVGYVPLSQETMEAVRQRYQEAQSGSIFNGVTVVGTDLLDRFGAEGRSP
jgi:phosphate transport system substrate-binding protein